MAAILAPFYKIFVYTLAILAPSYKIFASILAILLYETRRGHTLIYRCLNYQKYLHDRTISIGGVLGTWPMYIQISCKKEQEWPMYIQISCKKEQEWPMYIQISCKKEQEWPMYIQGVLGT
jgi:hypothetical protein